MGFMDKLTGIAERIDDTLNGGLNKLESAVEELNAVVDVVATAAEERINKVRKKVRILTRGEREMKEHRAEIEAKMSAISIAQGQKGLYTSEIATIVQQSTDLAISQLGRFNALQANSTEQLDELYDEIVRNVTEYVVPPEVRLRQHGAVMRDTVAAMAQQTKGQRLATRGDQESARKADAYKQGTIDWQNDARAAVENSEFVMAFWQQAKRELIRDPLMSKTISQLRQSHPDYNPESNALMTAAMTAAASIEFNVTANEDQVNIRANYKSGEYYREILWKQFEIKLQEDVQRERVRRIGESGVPAALVQYAIDAAAAREIYSQFNTQSKALWNRFVDFSRDQNLPVAQRPYALEMYDLNLTNATRADAMRWILNNQ